MLSFRDTIGRREFLRVGGLALGGLSLDSTFARAADGPARPITDKSVIFLFLHGGPSQIETFDPKMTAGEKTRSATGEVKTVIPGVTFGGTFPKLAARADQFSVVRSFVTGDGNHDIKPIVGRDTFGANLGAAYASLAGSDHPTSGLPRNLALFPQAIDPNCQPAQAAFGNFLSAGPFGPVSAPVPIGGSEVFLKNLVLNVPQERLDDRRLLLHAIDKAHLAFDTSVGGLDSIREKAFAVLLRGLGDAFNLAKEDPRTVAQYDTAPLVPVEKIDKKWNNHKYYADNTRTLGKLLLLARRLCERGAGFVTVTTNFVWDMHADVNNATMTEGMSYMAPSLDHAVSAFLDDVKQRGLDDRILLVACGEMGRTPTINKNGGRDHWGGLAPLLLAGAGIRSGQVIGRSDSQGGAPNSDPVQMKNLISTVLRTLFEVDKVRVTRGASRELLQMIDAQPIPGL